MLQSVTAIRTAVAASMGVAFAMILGIPTGIISTGWYTRMTPVLWWDYPTWVASSALAGALVATYVGPGSASVTSRSRGGVIGALLSLFAVGCPVCNKLVVFALGVTGALTWFAPVQPLLGIFSVLLLAAALRRRLRSLQSCQITESAKSV